MRLRAAIAAALFLFAAPAFAQNVAEVGGSVGGVGSISLGAVSINQPITPTTINAAAPGNCPTSPQQFEIADTTAGPLCLQVPFSAISGTASNSQLAGPLVSALAVPTQFTISNPGGVGTATVGYTANSLAAHNFGTGIDLTGKLTGAQPAFGDVSGTATDAQLASAYSGVGACGANTFASTLNRNAAPTCTQPATTNLSDVVSIGTWTPTIFGQSTAGTVTYTIQDGHYAKIGRFINASVFIRWSAISGMTGSVSISLPSSPTVLTSTNYFPEGAVGDIQGITFPAGTTYLTVEAQENTSRMDIFDNGSNVTSGNLQATALAGAGYLIASIQYLTN